MNENSTVLLDVFQNGITSNHSLDVCLKKILGEENPSAHNYWLDENKYSDVILLPSREYYNEISIKYPGLFTQTKERKDMYTIDTKKLIEYLFTDCEEINL